MHVCSLQPVRLSPLSRSWTVVVSPGATVIGSVTSPSWLRATSRVKGGAGEQTGRRTDKQQQHGTSQSSRLLSCGVCREGWSTAWGRWALQVETGCAGMGGGSINSCQTTQSNRHAPGDGPVDHVGQRIHPIRPAPPLLCGVVGARRSV